MGEVSFAGMAGLTGDTLRRVSLHSQCMYSLGPFHSGSQELLYSFPNSNGGHQGERGIFEVEGTWTNGIITPEKYLQSNYGLLLGISSFFFFFLSNEALLGVSDDGGKKAMICVHI